MSDQDTYRGVWARARAECIRLAFGKYLERDPKAALEHVNDKLAEASRLEEARANSRTII